MRDLILLVIIVFCTLAAIKSSLTQRKTPVNRKICYIIGAGLTKSLEASRKHRVPLMTDFVAVLADHIESNVVLTALTNFEKARVFDWSRPEWIAMAEALDDTSTADERKPYAEVLRRRPSENVEQLLRHSVKTRNGNIYASIVEDRFGFAINAVFARVGWNVRLDPLIGYLKRQFASANTTHTFISYNYDLVLDYCIQQSAVGRWYPETGYGIPFTQTIRIDEALDHMKQFKHRGGGAYSLIDPLVAEAPDSEILLLKPHGSLNWLVPFRGNYQFEDREPLLLGDQYRCIAYYTDFLVEQIRNTTQPQEIAFNAGLFITPPLDDDVSTEMPRFLKSVYEQSLRALREADEVVVIGWSMPSTDKAEVDRLSRTLAEGNPRRHVIAVNFNADLPYFERLAAVCHVDADRMRVFNSGFVDFASASDT